MGNEDEAVYQAIIDGTFDLAAFEQYIADTREWAAQESYGDGHADGHSDGYDVGFQDGWEEAKADDGA